MIKKIVIRLLCIAFLVFCLGYFILATEVGLALLFHAGRLFVPGRLTLAQLHGSVISGIIFQDLHYQDQERNLTIQTLKSRWQLKTLFRKPLFVVENLEIENAVIKLASSSASHKGQEWNFSRYFKYLRLNNIQLTHVQVFNREKLLVYIKRLNYSQTTLNNYVMLLQGDWNSHPYFGEGRLYFKEGYPYFEKLEVRYGKSRFSLYGELGQRWNLQAHLLIPRLETILPESKGFLSLQGNITGNIARPQLEVAVEAHRLQLADLSVDDLRGRLTSVFQEEFRPNGVFNIKQLKIDKIIAIPRLRVQINAYLNNDNSLIDCAASFGSKNQIVAHMKLPPLIKSSALSQSIQGVGTIAFLDLTALNRWVLDRPFGLHILQGKLMGSFQIDGFLNNPTLNYEIRLTKGVASLNEVGIRLSGLNIKARQKMGQEIYLDGGFKLGQGSGRLKGTISPQKNDLSADLSLIGENLNIYNVGRHKIIASPDLRLNLVNKTLFVKGDLIIPMASIHGEDFIAGVVLPSEVILADEDKKASANFYDNLAVKIKLIISNRIDVHYENLKAQLKGGLYITSTPGNSPIATGELHTLKGSYRAYGKQLDIQKGRLIYAGNLLSSPGLDIRAIKKIKTVAYADPSQMNINSLAGSSQSVGILVRGTLNKPVVSLFSDPPGLSQGDILSYLILDRPQSEATDGASLALLSAATSMAGGEGSEEFTKKIERKLGLDDLSIGTTEYFNTSTGFSQHSTTANVGKNLGSKVSLHYSVGLFDTVSIVRIRYQINRYLILQSETSSLENAGDLLYQVESSY